MPLWAYSPKREVPRHTFWVNRACPKNVRPTSLLTTSARKPEASPASSWRADEAGRALGIAFPVVRPGWPPAKRQRAIDRDRQCGLLFDDREIAGCAAILDPVDQSRQHVDIRWSAAADMIDAGRRVEPHEIGDAGFAHALLHLAKVTDPRVGALRIVGHVFKHDELAAMGLERAEIGVGGIHQRRDVAHPLGEILPPIFCDIEIRIAREDMLNAARAVDPGDAVGRQWRQHGRGWAGARRAPYARSG